MAGQRSGSNSRFSVLIGGCSVSFKPLGHQCHGSKTKAETLKCITSCATEDTDEQKRGTRCQSLSRSGLELNVCQFARVENLAD